MHYDVEAHWILNLICNYKCDYCISSAPKDPKLTGKLSAADYLDFFDSTGKRWLLHLTGGEPFFHRNFVDVAAALASHHYLSLNSNLSSPRVRDFARTVKPDRVAYIHCGVHPEERTARNGWSALLENISALVQAGFPVFASCVMTPAAFALFDDARERLRSVGVPLIPKLLDGTYHDRFYPQDYTDDERKQFRVLSDAARRDVETSPLQPHRHSPTVNPLSDRDFLEGLPDYTGVMCSAGRRYVSIGPDGNIYACGNSVRIGNLFRREIRWLKEDRPCRSDWCRYYCFRYSAIDETGAHRLPIHATQPSLANRLSTFMGKAERAIVNRLVQISVE